MICTCHHWDLDTRDHLNRSLGDQVVEPDSTVGTNKLNHLVLAVLSVEAALGVLLEPRVQTGTVDVDVARPNHTETPRHSTRGRVSSAVGESWVVGELLELRAEWLGSRWLLLEVRRLGLDHSHKEVGRIDGLVLVEDAVLGSGSIEPCWETGLDENTTGDVDVDLGLGRDIEIVVGNPGPDVLHVGAGLRSEMEKHGAGDTRGVDLASELGAVADGEVRAGGTTNAEMCI